MSKKKSILMHVKSHDGFCVKRGSKRTNQRSVYIQRAESTYRCQRAEAISARWRYTDRWLVRFDPRLTQNPLRAQMRICIEKCIKNLIFFHYKHHMVMHLLRKMLGGSEKSQFNEKLNGTCLSSVRSIFFSILLIFSQQ